MPLTKSFNETIKADLQARLGFRRALLGEAVRRDGCERRSVQCLKSPRRSTRARGTHPHSALTNGSASAMFLLLIPCAEER